MLALAVGGPLRAQQPDPREMSAKELLEYSLRDLQDTLLGAKEKNADLTDTNQTLRRRIQLLGTQKDDLQEQLGELRSSKEDWLKKLRLEEEDLSLTEKKRDNLQLFLEQSEKEAAELEKQFFETHSRQQKIKSEILKVQKDVEQLQAKFDTVKSAQSPKDIFSEEKAQVTASIRRVKKAAAQAKRDVLNFEKRLDAPLKQKTVLLSRQKDLQETLRQSRSSLNDALEQNARLKREQARVEQAGNQEIQMMRKDIAALADVKIGLQETVSAFSRAERALAQQQQKDLKQLADMKQLLTQERKWLDVKKAKAQNNLALMEDIQSFWDNQNSRDFDQVRALKQAYQEKETVRERLLKSLAQVDEKHAQLSRKESELEAGLREAQERLAQRDRELSGLQDRALAAERKRTVQDIQSEKRAISDLENQIGRQKTALGRLEEQLSDLRQSQSMLVLRKDELSDELKQLAVRKEGLKDDQAGVEQGAELSLAGLQESVAALRDRKQELELSMDLIQRRLDREAIADIGGFQKEEKQLNEYLAVLRQERNSLLEKINTLNLGLEKLLEQRENMLKENNFK